MKKTIILNSMLVLAIVLLALSTIITFSSKEAKAERIVYSAGILDGPICYCPVLVGNCVCATVIPD
jgi:uncharacterized membrane protein